jgi:hypothetical protein
MTLPVELLERPAQSGSVFRRPDHMAGVCTTRTIVLVAASFKDQHLDFGVFCRPRSQDEAGKTTAGDDIHHVYLLFVSYA